MLRPPSSARMPDTGTARLASGTPCAAAYAIVSDVKCPGTAIRNRREYRILPTSVVVFMGPCSCNRLARTAAWRIDNLLVSIVGISGELPVRRHLPRLGPEQLDQ